MQSKNQTMERDIGRRIAPRTRCGVVVEISDGSAGFQRALLTDFSKTGFRVSSVRQSVGGASLWLQPDGLQPIAAKIRWRGDGALGCQFLFPLSEAAEDSLKKLAAEVRAPVSAFSHCPSAVARADCC